MPIYEKEKCKIEFELPDLETVWVQATSQNYKLLVGNFYRAYNWAYYWDLVDQSFALACDANMKIVILGDFNKC